MEMPRRQEGIVVDKKEWYYYVATDKQIFIAREDDPIKIGDSVSFTPTPMGEYMCAKDPVVIPPIRNSKHHQDSLLVECKLIEAYSQTVMNQRVFRSDFVDKVREIPKWKNLNTNAFINKIVYIKCNIHPAKAPFWEIIEMVDDNNETKSLVGLPYFEKIASTKVRVYVPGYPEDFLLPKSLKISLDTWIKFDIFTKTAKADDTKPIESQRDFYETRNGGLLKLPLTRKNKEMKTELDEAVLDADQVLERFGIYGDFEKKEIWVRILESSSNKPIFTVSKEQFGNKSIMETRLPVQGDFRQNTQPLNAQRPLMRPSPAQHVTTQPHVQPVKPTESYSSHKQPPPPKPEVPTNRFRNTIPEDQRKRSKKKAPTSGRPNDAPVPRKHQERYNEPNTLEEYPDSERYDWTPHDSPPRNEPRPCNSPRVTESRANNSHFNPPMAPFSNDSRHSGSSRNSSYNASTNLRTERGNDFVDRSEQNERIVSLIKNKMRNPGFNDVIHQKFPDFYEQLNRLLSNL